MSLDRAWYCLPILLLFVGCTSMQGAKVDNGRVVPVSTNASAQDSISRFQSQCMAVAGKIAGDVTMAYWKERELQFSNAPKSSEGEVAREFRLGMEAQARTHPDYRDYGSEIIVASMKVCEDQTNYFDMKTDRARSRHEMLGLLGNGLFSVVKAIAPWYAGAKIAEHLKDLNQTNTNVGGDNIGGDHNPVTTTEVFEPSVE